MDNLMTVVNNDQPIGTPEPLGTVAALRHTLARATEMLARGPYPRQPQPDEVWCLDCRVVMPVMLQAEHRSLYGHRVWEWAGSPRAPQYTFYENVPHDTA